LIVLFLRNSTLLMMKMLLRGKQIQEELLELEEIQAKEEEEHKEEEVDKEEEEDKEARQEEEAAEELDLLEVEEVYQEDSLLIRMDLLVVDLPVHQGEDHLIPEVVQVQVEEEAQNLLDKGEVHQVSLLIKMLLVEEDQEEEDLVQEEEHLVQEELPLETGVALPDPEVIQVEIVELPLETRVALLDPEVIQVEIVEAHLEEVEGEALELRQVMVLLEAHKEEDLEVALKVLEPLDLEAKDPLELTLDMVHQREQFWVVDRED